MKKTNDMARVTLGSDPFEIYQTFLEQESFSGLLSIV